MAAIGFIGVGNMGAGMARNLAKAGHDVLAFDLDAARLEALADDGVAPAQSAEEAAAQADFIITMLPAGKHVAAVYETLLNAARPGALMIDCSTIDVATARETAEKAASAGFQMLDAPVSGGVSGADAGTLAFMIGGPREAYERALPLFDIMGAKAVHCGEAGAGQSAKICNNLMLAIQMISVAEGFVLAEKLGLDPHKLYDVSSAASGQCWSLTTYCPLPGVGPTSPADNGYKPGFAAGLMAKDLRLAKGAADSAGAPITMIDSALAHFAAMREDEDFSGVINLVREGRQ